MRYGHLILYILMTLIIGVFQGCISDNVDAFEVKKDSDALITSVEIKTGENTLQTCADGIDNDGDAGWLYLDGDTINKNILEVTAQSGEILRVLVSFDIEYPKDSIANDGIDCHDQECQRFEHCLAPVENSALLCQDTIDNDKDGRVDCADTDCQFFSHCMENSDDTCQDEIDNDFDGLIDCDDPGCFGLIVCNGITYDTVQTSPGMLVVFRNTLPEEGLMGAEAELYKDSSEYMMPFGTVPQGVLKSVFTQYEGVQWRYNFNGDEGTPYKDQKVSEQHIQPYFKLISQSECLGENGEPSIDGKECIEVSFPKNIGGWGGAFLQFGDYLIDGDGSMAGSKTFREQGDLRDLSKWSHNKIKFELKSRGLVSLKVQWGTDMTGQAGATFRDYILINEGVKDEEGNKVLWEPDGNWHSIALDVDDDIGSDDFQIFSNPLGFWTNGTDSLHAIYIDNIRYEGRSEQLCAYVGSIYMCNNE